MNKGIKHDTGKPMFGLMPPNIELDVVKVLTYGAEKYSPDNWRHVEKQRYIDAMGRHWNAYRRGELVDEETGISHLAHAICCLMFIGEMNYLDKPPSVERMKEYAESNRDRAKEMLGYEASLEEQLEIRFGEENGSGYEVGMNHLE